VYWVPDIKAFRTVLSLVLSETEQVDFFNGELHRLNLVQSLNGWQVFESRMAAFEKVDRLGLRLEATRDEPDFDLKIGFISIVPSA